ncbi:MAG: hypothetical protein ACE5FG_14550 [Myxococcota bacterium]
MGKHLRLFALLPLSCGVLVWIVLAAPSGASLVHLLDQIRSGGGPLLEVQVPDDRAVLTVGAVEVLVRFPFEDRVLPETFRCLLNNEDVTDLLTLGRNGAAGHLYGLVAGENRLRFSVFGRGWWPGRYLEDVHERIVRIAPRPHLDQARAAGLTQPAPSLVCCGPGCLRKRLKENSFRKVRG